MSRENIEHLRQALEAFNERREAAFDLAPDFELHQASSIIDTAGVFHGPDALRDSARELFASFEDLRFHPEEFLEAPGGEVVALILVQGRGRGSGLEIDNPIAWVLTFREEQIARLVVYEERADALAVVGLPERPVR